MARKCIRFKRTRAGKRCAKYSGRSRRSGGRTRTSGKRKGRCTKWSKGRTRCMKRAR